MLQVLKKIVRLASAFPFRRPFGLESIQPRPPRPVGRVGGSGGALWAAKVKGGNGSIIASITASRSGLCPELLANFRIPKPPGCSQGNPGAVLLCSPSGRFSGRGGEWGASPGRGGRVGVPRRVRERKNKNR